jgi:hypothetical protein
VLYEPTPVEPTPQPSAYDHLPPYTSLAPRRKATVWMPPTLATDVAAQTAATPRSRMRPASWFVAITVIIMLLAALRPLLASPEQLLGQTRATAPTFSVALLDGTSQLLQDPSMVVRIALSTTETFTVWASPTSAVQPCDAEIAQRAAAGMSGTRTAVTVYLDGALTVGTRVGDPPFDETIVCAQRNGTRYVIDDTAIVTTSSFGTMAASWRWS